VTLAMTPWFSSPSPGLFPATWPRPELVGSHVAGTGHLREGLGGQLLVRVEVHEWWHGVVLSSVGLDGLPVVRGGPARPRCGRRGAALQQA
jgi:hypothetical protein